MWCRIMHVDARPSFAILYQKLKTVVILNGPFWSLTAAHREYILVRGKRVRFQNIIEIYI